MEERYLRDIGELRYFEVTEGTVLIAPSFPTFYLGGTALLAKLHGELLSEFLLFHVPLLIFVAYKKSG